MLCGRWNSTSCSDANSLFPSPGFLQQLHRNRGSSHTFSCTQPTQPNWKRNYVVRSEGYMSIIRNQFDFVPIWVRFSGHYFWTGCDICKVHAQVASAVILGVKVTLKLKTEICSCRGYEALNLVDTADTSIKWRRWFQTSVPDYNVYCITDILTS